MPTEVDPRAEKRRWERATEQRHRFQLDRPAARIGEMEDLHFHVDSAVLLPAREGRERGLRGGEGAITGLAVLRAAYLHAKEAPSDRLLVVGHTDPSGKEAYNLELSRLRAQSVLHALKGERDPWAKIADRRHRVEDVQWILDWAARAWGWPCTPGPVDGEERPVLRRAIERFQARYNADFEREISVDGMVGPETWGAVFDLYARELAELLDTDEAGLDAYRKRLRFLSGKPEAVGCGEHHAGTAGRAAGSRALSDRRVELLFFGADEPKLRCHPSAESCAPERCDVYNVFAWRWERVEVEPAPTLVWLDLQTVDALGYRVPNVGLRLEPEKGEAQEITTDGSGYWSGRVRAAGGVRITLADGSPVRLGPSRTGDEEATGDAGSAVLTPRLAARTVTDIVVPGASEEALAERRRLRARYGPRQAGGGSARGGEGAEPVGEESGSASSRGGAAEEVTRRTVADHCADDLFVAGGLTDDAQFDLDALVEHLHSWIEDRHPSVAARGYYLQLVSGSVVKLVDVNEGSAEPVGDFELEEGQGVSARYGAHAVFEALGGAKGDARLVDMASATTGVRFGEDDASYLWQILRADQQEAFLDACLERTAQGKTDLLYLLPPSPGAWVYVARRGGTGLFEDYPSDAALRSRVQTRNEAVARGVDEAYGYYVRDYIQKVEAIDPDPTAAESQGLPHPEQQLYELGPPEPAYTFPKPAGARSDEYRGLVQAGSEHSAYDAWQAVSEKLDAIWGVRSAGSVWIDFEVGADAGGLADAKVKWNFEVDERGCVKGPTETRELSAGGGGKVGGADVGATLTAEKKEGSDETKWSGKLEVGPVGIEADSEGVKKGSAALGPWGFEGDSTGTVTGSYGPAEGSVNPKTGKVAYGLELDLHGIAEKAYGKDLPDWVDELPNLTLKTTVHVRLLTQGDVLEAIAGPGFWGARPRSELVRLDWDSLDYDEQSHLVELGWDKRRWDEKELPDSAKQQFAELPGDAQMAAVLLPVPSRDPEWKEFWSGPFLDARPGAGGASHAGSGGESGE